MPADAPGPTVPDAPRQDAVVLLTTADTEILAAARAVGNLPDGFPAVRCVNPATEPDLDATLDRVLDGARIVLVRLLGGRRAWQDGFDRLVARCERDGIALLAFGGEAEPDAELTAASTAAPGVVAEAFEYLRQGGVANTENLLRFVVDTVLLEGHGFAPPETLAELGVYVPGRGDVTVEEALATHDPSKPTVGLITYRTHRVSGNMAFADTLIGELQDQGVNVLTVWCGSLRPDTEGRVAALELVDGRVDTLITTVLASGGSNAGDMAAAEDQPGEWIAWDAKVLAALDVPVIQGICATIPRARWADSDAGLTPLDAAMQVAIPEFDGRIIGVPFSFKEREADDASPVGAALSRYVADPERTARLAELAVRHAKLRHTPPAEKKVALILSSFPTKHARIGNAVGLDTPASAIRVLDAFRDAGYDIGGDELPFADGDALIHALIAAGGHDVEFLTEEQLSLAHAKLDVARYAEWFALLPQSLQDKVVATWGAVPGELYVHDGDVVFAGLRLGNVFVGIQPPRGFGEDPTAMYHDPELAPTHHYLAAYWWLEREFGADAVVHLGKHGTLEWMPGKGVGNSADSAPDAILGSLPLFYPFVVNDPGEGVQAKRRAHATIIDHLVPPMARAETYDELAQLEQLLDDHARAEALDPAKLPAIAGRIWELVREAELQHDLGVGDDAPEDEDAFSSLIEHLDGYLCEIKDIQIRDGLHVLGVEPEGDAHRNLVAAILRLGSGDVVGLRRAIGAAYGLDEAALTEAPGVRVDVQGASVPGLVPHPGTGTALDLLARFPGPSASGGDLIDRLEEAQTALLDALRATGWSADRAEIERVCADVLGHADRDVAHTLRFAAAEVIPRLAGTSGEITALLHGLAGGFVPAGPSGSPTRGRVDVLPTGRNFYAVDPKALPSPLSWDVGTRLADDLLARHVEEDGGRYPETVGIILWGTAAMRTQGDDIAEVLSLLGVKPRWNPESRRIVGLDVVPLEELGRPRIDVAVRISGFFRDAFPDPIRIMDEAVRIVADLDEPAEANFVRKHALEDRDRLVAELGEAAGWRRATTRIFGSKPGAYGAGLIGLIDGGNWRGEADLAEVYEVWGGYAYGQGLDGVEARGALRDTLARVEVAVKNIDNREHDLLDSDGYFQYHGGMVAAVRTLTGTAPRAWIGDSSDPASVRTRSLAEETRRVFRARVANPRWIGAMMRHGYKGAFELSATVDYLFGYDATAGVVEDWMYATLAEKYVLDPETADQMRASNPWALRAIGERLLEAADRGLWEAPDPALLDRLREGYLSLEGELEGAGS